MKQLIITISIFLFSLTAFAQNKVSKEDSIKIAETNKKIIQIEDKTNIQELKVWLFKNYLTAEKWQEFFAGYNAFIDYKLSTLPKEEKPKTTK